MQAAEVSHAQDVIHPNFQISVQAYTLHYKSTIYVYSICIMYIDGCKDVQIYLYVIPKRV